MNRAPLPLLALCWTAVTALLVKRQWLAFAVHDLQWSQDLAFFNQILFHASRGEPWTSSLLLEPTGFFSMVHFHPIFAAVLPVFALAPSPRTLLLINAVAVCSAAFPLAGLARAASGSRWMGLAAGLAFLLWVPTWSGAGADFRPMVFVVPGIATLLWGVYGGRWWGLFAGAALCCAAREEASYLLAAFGAVLLVVPFGGWRWRQGLAVMGTGLAWFAFLVVFKENFFFHFDPRRPPVDALPPTELLVTRGWFLLKSGVGPWLAAPLAPAPLVMALAPLAWLMPDAAREWHSMTGPYVHLRSALLPLLAASGAVGVGVLVRRWPRAAWGLGPMMVLGALLSFPQERRALQERSRGHAEQLESTELLELNAMLRQIGPQDRVATDYRLIAALSGRSSLRQVRHLYLDDGQPPHWTVEWPLTLERYDTLLVPMDDPVLEHLTPDWEQVQGGAGYGLFRRSSEPAQGWPEPLP